MKTLVVSAILCCALALLPRASSAQTITINSVSGTRFCAGDPIAVTFTVTGTWLHRNAFTVQLSDPTGSFSSSFQNLGSIADTLPGTFTLDTTIPVSTSSIHYRIRVIGALPYTVSPDNGTDISIGTAVHYYVQGFTALAINTPSTFDLSHDFNADLRQQNDTIYWDFGSGANPASAIDYSNSINIVRHTTTYSTPGLKTVVATSVSPGGCSVSDSLVTYVFDCSPRRIPHDAFVIDKDSNLDNATVRIPLHSSIWVNPGVTVTGGELDTIYAESGSTIGDDGPGDVVFLQPGALYTGSVASLIVYADGAGVNPNFGGGPTLKCSSLQFDYTDAPPNKAFDNSGVAMDAVAKTISIAPNPTNGNLSIGGIPHNAINISVLDLLGATVMNFAKPTADMQIDLNALPAGAYYVRFSMPNGVVTKKIVKE